MNESGNERRWVGGMEEWVKTNPKSVLSAFKPSRWPTEWARLWIISTPNTHTTCASNSLIWYKPESEKINNWRKACAPSTRHTLSLQPLGKAADSTATRTQCLKICNYLAYAPLQNSQGFNTSLSSQADFLLPVMLSNKSSTEVYLWILTTLPHTHPDSWWIRTDREGWWGQGDSGGRDWLRNVDKGGKKAD